jgi:hypothetical protein
MTDAVLAVLILLPLLITFFLKSNAALGILALTGGYALESLAGSDVHNGLINMNMGGLRQVDVDLLLILLPLILTLLLTGRSWQGRSKMITNCLGALAAGIMLVIISLPFLGAIVNLDLFNSKVWPLLQHIQAPAIIFGVTYALVLTWLSRGKEHKKHKH